MRASVDDSAAALEEYAADFTEEPGYLDFAAVGPLGRAVVAEEAALRHVLQHSRFGALSELSGQDERMRRAVAGLLRIRSDQVVFQPTTSQGLMHAAFGVTGEIAVAPGEFPALTYAVQRAYDALGSVPPSSPSSPLPPRRAPAPQFPPIGSPDRRDGALCAI